MVWCRCQKVKKCEDIFSGFETIHGRHVTDGQTPHDGRPREA